MFTLPAHAVAGIGAGRFDTSMFTLRAHAVGGMWVKNIFPATGGLRAETAIGSSGESQGCEANAVGSI